MASTWTQNISCTLISISAAALGTATFKLIWKQSHSCKFSHCNIVLAWSLIAFYAHKRAKSSDKKTKQKTLKHLEEFHNIFFSLSTDNISLEWELKRESLLSGRMVAAVSLSNPSNREKKKKAKGMDEAEVKKRECQCSWKYLIILVKKQPQCYEIVLLGANLSLIYDSRFWHINYVETALSRVQKREFTAHPFFLFLFCTSPKHLCYLNHEL